uniref:Uncharacterized protein n=1 Tax=Anguilla anguilla TaxID=7936 RepID=A0A0E9PRA2_ANGAN
MLDNECCFYCFFKRKSSKSTLCYKKKTSKIVITIKIWLKIFYSVIQPIALYGSEVWGPLKPADLFQ